MPVPSNAQTIWQFLIKQGLTANAAAGILGNIEQESGGIATAGVWPGNYGLIQWTPATPYFPGGPPSLQQQLPAIISYINQNGSIADINANASSPSAAALYFSNKYERPNAALANNQNRQQSAQEVYSAAQSGKWPTGGGTTTTTSSQTSSQNLTPQDALSAMGTVLHDTAEFLNFFFEWLEPGQTWRLIAGVTAIGTGFATVKLYASPRGDDQLPLIFLLAGVAAGGAYMAFRPWPETSGEPIRPAAYAVDVFQGDIPAGTPPVNQTTAIEAGLTAYVGYKIISGTAGLAAGAAGILGTIWAGLKGLGKDAESDLPEAAADLSYTTPTSDNPTGQVTTV